MATSKGKGGAGRPRKAETVAAHGLALSVVGAKAEPKDSWRKRTVYVSKDGTLSTVRRKGFEALPMQSPTPQGFAGIVVVAAEGTTVDKAAASLRESVGRLLRADPTAAAVASLSEGFTFDDGTDAMVVLFYNAPKALQDKAPRKVTRKAPAKAPRKRTAK